jgi:hypothetical protein
MALQTVEELIAERDYLLRWLGGFHSELTGLSADALSRVAFGVITDPGLYYPSDSGDLGRCERAYTAMPPHLQERVLPLLEQWRYDVDRIESERADRSVPS